MAKLTYEDKKEMIRLHLEEHIGYIEIARRFNVSKKVSQMLIEKYKVQLELYKKELEESLDRKVEKIYIY